MKPIYLYIENFTSHKESEIDFSGFATALIIGKMDNNSLISNGVGKTSILRAIEYVLFNQTRDPITDKDLLLEDLILEGSKKCKVIFDFSIGNDIYRVIRARTDKGVSDLSFFKRSAVFDERNAHTIETDKELWLDCSSRTIQQTELDLIKTIRMNYKAFINTCHFMQFDFKSSLAATTPAHRKTILKEVLDLVIYSRLEKISKTAAENILKDIENERNNLSRFGNPQNELDNLEKELSNIDKHIELKSQELVPLKDNQNNLNVERENLLSKLSKLETRIASSISKRDNLLVDINKLNTSLTEYSNKRQYLSNEAKQLIDTVGKLKEEKSNLDNIDFSTIKSQKEELQNISLKITALRTQINSFNDVLLELNIPLPEDGTCKHCRSVLTKEHKDNCQKDIEQQKEQINNKIKDNNDQIRNLLIIQQSIKDNLQVLENQFTQFTKFSNQISLIDKEINDKKSIYSEYTKLIESFGGELNIKNDTLQKAKLEIEQSSEQQISELKQNILINKKQLASIIEDMAFTNNQINSLNSKRAVIIHSIDNKKTDIVKKSEIEQTIRSLEEKYAIYPFVIQAFSSTGIPSIIINNILDDLQMEANNLLSQLRPGLQLEFEIEKTNTDGTKEDTLNIIYFLNNKPRKYGQLSGAQKVFIMFALKLGLSFLLKKIMGTQLNLLMIDEIDQPMDDASVDALTEIIKHFQKDFTILIITHRKRLQDKFSTAILVEQNQDMISRAKVVSNW